MPDVLIYPSKTVEVPFVMTVQSCGTLPEELRTKCEAAKRNWVGQNVPGDATGVAEGARSARSLETQGIQQANRPGVNRTAREKHRRGTKSARRKPTTAFQTSTHDSVVHVRELSHISKEQACANHATSPSTKMLDEQQEGPFQAKFGLARLNESLPLSVVGETHGPTQGMTGRGAKVRTAGRSREHFPEKAVNLEGNAVEANAPANARANLPYVHPFRGHLPAIFAIQRRVQSAGIEPLKVQGSRQKRDPGESQGVDRAQVGHQALVQEGRKDADSTRPRSYPLPSEGSAQEGPNPAEESAPVSARADALKPSPPSEAEQVPGGVVLKVKRTAEEENDATHRRTRGRSNGEPNLPRKNREHRRGEREVREVGQLRVERDNVEGAQEAQIRGLQRNARHGAGQTTVRSGPFKSEGSEYPEIRLTSSSARQAEDARKVPVEEEQDKWAKRRLIPRHREARGAPEAPRRATYSNSSALRSSQKDWQIGRASCRERV